MFEGLFEENSEKSNSINPPKRFGNHTDPRKQHRLCGLFNQGATCYLNSLIQTLFFTSEFRGTVNSSLLIKRYTQVPEIVFVCVCF